MDGEALCECVQSSVYVLVGDTPACRLKINHTERALRVLQQTARMSGGWCVGRGQWGTKIRFS